MIFSRIKFFFPLFFIFYQTEAQKIKKADKLLLANLRTHIEYLSSDMLEGRRTGTNGEKLAMNYISTQFREIGLQAKGKDGFFQSFDVHEGKLINDSTFLFFNKNKLIQGSDFFPFPFSPNASISAIVFIALRESEHPWFVDLKEIIEENKNNPHYDLEDYIKNNAKRAAERGASAIIIYNSSETDDKLVFNSKDKSELLSIPVVYVSKNIARKYLSDDDLSLEVKMKVDIGEKIRTGNNVIGYIDNGAATTVVLGAHFDHLGYGEDGNSMLRTGEKLIHNGADDNASGTAAVIELARRLQKSNVKKNNYLFIAFSGEELGLFGSKYFTENPTIDFGSIGYMINLDMIGRLNDSSKTVTIGGYGTSPEWGKVFSTFKQKKNSLAFKYDSSGTGPSDHTSFYRKDIPVLFYFTGLHADYHKPTDDFEKINYTGSLLIVNQIYELVHKLNSIGKPAFAKTRETQTSTSARFSVSLGIMPDYTYSGSGVRADGISDGRPAQKAGIIAGDIVIQIGEHNINSLENYMQTLGKFKKGDKTKVKYKRGNDIYEAEVEF